MNEVQVAGEERPTFTIRAGGPEDDALIAEHFRQMWLDNGVSVERISETWREDVLAFVGAARQAHQYRSFLAEQGPGKVVGSASCQLFAGLYPNILQAKQRKYGYVWGVYVQADCRKRGIATALTQATLEHLRAIACSHALLHASPSGRSVYESLAFQPTNEMRLDLSLPLSEA
ncbi:MAG TPA: GNAT family N-acetyltransferase [Polyangiaceae bacterium]|nr:GNAT family N-acetyltransferase [Polyangiaceae bacterium]